MTTAQKYSFGLPKFHVPTQKWFHEALWLAEQRKVKFRIQWWGDQRGATAMWAEFSGIPQMLSKDFLSLWVGGGW